MLKVANLDAYIEKTQILRNVSLDLPKGAMAGLIGRNGAGKTTLMRSIMGLLKLAGGAIAIDGADVTHVPGFRRAGLQVGYMPEDRRLVPELTVEENVLVPAWANELPDAPARLKRIYELMPEVAGFAQRRALQLSGGQQKLVALARAIMAGRRLLLLDEPFEGVAPVLARRLAEVIASLRTAGLSVVLSESSLTHAHGLLDRVFDIDRGAVTLRS
jgi:branched-chain amino acid transport system ATP-binding protein